MFVGVAQFLCNRVNHADAVVPDSEPRAGCSARRMVESTGSYTGDESTAPERRLNSMAITISSASKKIRFSDQPGG